MSDFDKCPICRSIKQGNQPEAINGMMDVFYICGNSITYEVNNPESYEESGVCKNKIDWDSIYIDYGKEFDESAKLVDSRFHGWVELQFYKEAHQVNNWRNRVNFFEKNFIDEYFDNKELYIKKLREQNSEHIIKPISVPEMMVQTSMEIPIRRTVIKNYYQKPWLGKFIVEEVDFFTRGEFDISIYRVIMSKDCPDKVGSYVVEEVSSNNENNKINFYEKEIIDIIIRTQLSS